jgi:hypothetical protein
MIVANNNTLSKYVHQRPASHPMIYAYSDSNPQVKGLLKAGYTEKDMERRVAQQGPTQRPHGLRGQA